MVIFIQNSEIILSNFINVRKKLFWAEKTSNFDTVRNLFPLAKILLFVYAFSKQSFFIESIFKDFL